MYSKVTISGDKSEFKVIITPPLEVLAGILISAILYFGVFFYLASSAEEILLSILFIGCTFVGVWVYGMLIVYYFQYIHKKEGRFILIKHLFGKRIGLREKEIEKIEVNEVTPSTKDRLKNHVTEHQIYIDFYTKGIRHTISYSQPNDQGLQKELKKLRELIGTKE